MALWNKMEYMHIMELRTKTSLMCPLKHHWRYKNSFNALANLL